LISHDTRLEGFTGADLLALLAESARQTMREFFSISGSGISEQPMESRVHLRHFQAAIEKKIRPSVNEEVSTMLQHFVVA
jgi:SpoVK/Ycf46/Vps4 family AAA+-type ATPase